MKFAKDVSTYKLEQPFNLVTDVLIDERKTLGHLTRMVSTTMAELNEMKEGKKKDIAGRPLYFAADADKRELYIFPKPDRDYTSEVYLAYITKV